MEKLVLDRIRSLKKLFEEGKIPTLAVHEVHPDLDKGDRINYIYFTLPVSLNFQRSSPAMWQAALKTYEDPETNYLFYPEKVVDTPREKVQADLLKHKLGLQRNKHTDIWIALSKGFNKHFNNDPRELIKQTDGDVEKILKIIRDELKADFPFLRGLKLSNYWLYILTKYTDVKLKNLNKISIIPDTHIIQSTVKLGICDDKADSQKVVEEWFLLTDGSEIIPVEMHSVLWNWSRNNFLPEV